MREMNEVEKLFYDTYVKALKVWRLNILPDNIPLKPQYPYKGYILDFMYEESGLENIKFCIEIDGQDYHKTKEQRLHDYQRERYLQEEGFVVIRFTASEVYVDAWRCVEEFHRIMFRTFEKFEKYADKRIEIQQEVYKDLRADKEGA
jgi:very-short-patch-repair endonuclease